MKPGEFVSSDHHFGHVNVIKYSKRPFKHVDEMNEALIAAWNAKVPEEAIVYHLGDFAFARSKEIINIRRRLHGTIRLIRGNHDKRLIRGEVKNCFEWVKDYYESKTEDGIKVVMCHYPFLTWNGSHRGSWNLAGHSHGNLPDSGVRRLDIGVDTRRDFAPYSFEEIVQKMDGRTFGPNHP